MGFLNKSIILLFLLLFVRLYAEQSEIVTKKSINVKKSDKSKYKVNPFTNINLFSKSKNKKEEADEKQQHIKNQEEHTQESKRPKIKNTISKDYKSQLKYLNSLRYEVFSLKQQLGNKEQIHIPYGSYIDKDESAIRFNAITQGYNDALKKSGLFVGVNIGMLDIYTSGYINDELVVTRVTPIVYGGSGGYQKFFNHYVGTRLYGGLFTSLFTDISKYNISNGSTTLIPNPYGGNGNLENLYVLAFMSADLLFEFPLDLKFQHYIGGFMGLNIGMMYYRSYAKLPQNNSYYPVKYIWDYNLQVDYSFNLGINLTLYNIHRLELGLGIPFSYLTLPGFAESANPLEKIPSQFWRSAVFLINYKVILKL